MSRSSDLLILTIELARDIIDHHAPDFTGRDRLLDILDTAARYGSIAACAEDAAIARQKPDGASP